MNKSKTATYSKSYTLILTKYCSNFCSYCGFRKKDDGLIPDVEVENILKHAKATGHREILVMSGERPESSSRIKNELRERGYSSYIDFVYNVCKKILEHGLLPHTNIGVLDINELKKLREVNASMGLMLENINEEFGKRIHPQKKAVERLSVIENAGKLKIPFTTGIIIGLGETRRDRIESINALLNLHSMFNHIQEIILQNFVPNKYSKRKAARKISINEYEELINLVNDNSNIAVQIPQNLNPLFKGLILKGAADLGGISEGCDMINPEKPWSKIEKLRKDLNKSGIQLKPRLPIYPKYIKLGWYSPFIKKVIDDLEEKNKQ